MKAKFVNAVLLGLGVSLVALALAACGSDPEHEPATPKPVVQPALTATSKPAVQPAPTATVKPVAESVSTATPKPVAESVSTATPKPVAQPVPTATPQPVAQPTPTATAKPTAQPTPTVAPRASVSGSVTYRERIALSPGAKLVVELLDVSLADAPSTLIAGQTIDNPGQVPIEFDIAYDPDAIDSRNTYAISASIIEADGRLVFINDTAYDVITHGSPNEADMVLVMVQPEPEPEPQPGKDDPDSGDWVEVPAQVIWANLAPGEGQHSLRVVYYRSAPEGCYRPGSQSVRVDVPNIYATVTVMQPPGGGANSCDGEMAEADAIVPIGATLAPGETYHVVVNDSSTASFSLPRPGLAEPVTEESPVESAEIMILESWPPQYQVVVVSGLPRGSGCSQFNGYETRRREPNEIEIVITHHRVGDGQPVACTADYPIVETIVPLGSDFESGEKYVVRVNWDIEVPFTAQ